MRPSSLLSLALALCACGDPAEIAPPGPDGSVAAVGADGSVACAAPPFDAAIAPPRLSLSGLFDACAAGLRDAALAPGVRGYQPAFALWTDGAEKRRFVRLPEGAVIDSRDPDRLEVPPGTRFWKEFRVGGRPIETRMLTRTGAGPEDYAFAVYRWDADGRDAVRSDDGASNVDGSGHDIPAVSQCGACHRTGALRVLGFSAVQLDHAGAGLSLGALSAAGLLSHPVTTARLADADEATRAALGTLHANCGHCHNPAGVSFARPFSLALRAADRAAADTDAYHTAVGVPMQGGACTDGGQRLRIQPGDPQGSCIVARMGRRDELQMPPLGTTRVDGEGRGRVAAWISAMR